MQTFDTPAPISAVLDIPAGRIQVIAADRTDTIVEVRPADPARRRDTAAAEQTETDYRDGVLRIQAPAAKNRLTGPSGAVEVTVRVPEGSRVDAKSSCAGFRGVGRLGEVACEGAAAGVKIDEASGVRLTAFGDVSVGRLTGSSRISTRKGDVRIDEAASGTLELATMAGDVTVGAAAGVSASLDAGTDHGRIRNALAGAGEAGAALEIRATTMQGDITARSL
ncbi:DUF4097 family beta strand repeat-containing protein [Nocardiopsis potens]|uniref:DUF4097 family beta strand repeat-containing protein n=1 Tax=Nocardiopsis potens TaxID=1246458 RepID=UPI00034539DA|nr:DUF4097 family beta strand repeat-containing protein [Nocardiopsis potens]